ncbi:MAG: ATP-binding cassette domain-containing protein [Candidatus Scalindua sp.]|nr:ATP-binding cassette domain-containing protein [Candidatus Scalindua sp.]
MIEIQGVSKAYGLTAALHSINLTVPAGQTTVFIGQSGCGKSTILRLIIGLIQADSGSVFFK